MAVTPHYDLGLFTPLGVGWREDATAGALLDADMMLIDAALYELSQSGGSVTSVNGQTGVVVLTAAEVGADASGAAAAAQSNAEAYANGLASNYDAAGAAATALSTAEASAAGLYIPLSVLTTEGDMLYENASLGKMRLPIGNTNQILSITGGLPAWSDFPNFASLLSYLPNVKLVPIYQSYTGGPMLDFYTVPTGRRALISTAKVDGNAGPGIGTAFQLLLKASGAYYYLGAPLAYSGVEINLAVSSSGTAGGGYIAEAGESFSIAQVFGTNWSVNNIPVQAVAAATTTTLTLTSAKAQVNGLTEYVGTITGGAAAFSGRQFTVSGFSNAGNNGTFTCVTANTTSIVLQNIGGVAESASASIAYYSAVYTVAGSNTTTLAAVAVQISNCTNAANNGTFPVITSATQSLTLNNPNAVLESPAAASASVVIVAPFSVNAWIIEFDNTAALRSSKLLAPEVFTPQVLYTPSGSKNGLLVNVGNVPTVGSIYATGSSLLNTATVYTYYVKGAAITQPLTAATTAANGLTAYSGNIQFGSGTPSAVTAATAIASSYAITTVAVLGASWGSNVCRNLPCR